jgi:hypothetical protein
MMKSKKTRFSLCIGYCIVILLLAACGSSNPSAPTTKASSTPKVALGNESVKSITAATLSGDFREPLDSTPDLNGTTIYFTATGTHG